MLLGSLKEATSCPWTYCEYRVLRDLRDLWAAAATPLVLESQLWFYLKGTPAGVLKSLVHLILCKRDFALVSLRKEFEVNYYYLKAVCCKKEYLVLKLYIVPVFGVSQFSKKIKQKQHPWTGLYVWMSLCAWRQGNTSGEDLDSILVTPTGVALHLYFNKNWEIYLLCVHYN